MAGRPQYVPVRKRLMSSMLAWSRGARLCKRSCRETAVRRVCYQKCLDSKSKMQTMCESTNLMGTTGNHRFVLLQGMCLHAESRH